MRYDYDTDDELEELDEYGNMHYVDEEGGDDLDDDKEHLSDTWQFVVTPLSVKPWKEDKIMMCMKDPTLSKSYSSKDMALAFYLGMTNNKKLIEKQTDLLVGHSYNKYEVIHTAVNKEGEEKVYEIPFSCFIEIS